MHTLTSRLPGIPGVLDALWEPRSSGVLYAVSALLGLAYAVWLIDAGFLLGTGEYWQTIVGDPAQHVAGYYYFVQDKWRFPIFLTKNYGFPDGVNIIFTDSVPIVSLLAKVLHGLLPDGFNVFGPWLVACYVLQGVGITSLVIALGNRSLAIAAAATLLALSLPEFLVRVQLASLLAQFLLTFALALYFHLARGPRRGPALWWFSVLLLSALLIHPYLFAMVFAILAAAVGQRVLDDPRWWRPALAYGVAVAAALVATMYVTGYIGSGAERGSPSEFGTRDTSLDVLAPVLPESSALMPWGGPIANFGADYFNYLGLGVLLLVAVHLVASWRAILEGARRHPVLCLLLVGFTVFAVSNTIRVAGTEVFSIRIPHAIHWLISQFRASARFFWPVSYMILAGVVVLTAQRFRRPVAALLLAGAVVLQLLDTAPVRATVYRYSLGADNSRTLLDRATWEFLVSKHGAVQLLPSFPCRSWEEQDLREIDEALQLLAAKSNRPMNSLYISGNRARSTKDCAEERDNVIGLQPGPRELYVFFSDHYAPTVANRLFGAGDCRQFKQGYACTRLWSALERTREIPGFTPAPSSIGYRLGSTIDFRSGGNSRDYLAGGWLLPEPAGSRLDGPNAYLELRLDQPAETALNLTLRTWPVHVDPRPPVVEVDVTLNGTSLGTMHVDTRESEVHSFTIPAEATGDSPVLTLQLRSADIAANGRRRNRRLDLGIQTLTVTADD